MLATISLVGSVNLAATATLISAGCAVTTSFNAALIRVNEASLIVNSWGQLATFFVRRFSSQQSACRTRRPAGVA